MKTDTVRPLFWAALIIALMFSTSCGHLSGSNHYGTAVLEEPEPSHITILGLTLGVDRLTDARDLIGPAVVTKGEYRHEPYVLCYRSEDPSDPAVLTMWTDYYGDWERLTGFELSAGEGSGGCAPSGLVNSGISTPSGLRLGLTRPEVVRILGQPGVESDGVMKYLYIEEEELDSDRFERLEEFGIATTDYDVISTVIELDFDGGRVSRLRVRWSESI